MTNPYDETQLYRASAQRPTPQQIVDAHRRAEAERDRSTSPLARTMYPSSEEVDATTAHDALMAKLADDGTDVASAPTPIGDDEIMARLYRP